MTVFTNSVDWRRKFYYCLLLYLYFFFFKAKIAQDKILVLYTTAWDKLEGIHEIKQEAISFFFQLLGQWDVQIRCSRVEELQGVKEENNNFP